MDNYKIDITGDDLLSKNAGLIVVYNNELVYAYKLSSDLQTTIRNNFTNGNYCFENKKLLKPRVYCAILTSIIKKIAQENATDLKNFQMNICNDMDGHSQNIIDILKQHFKDLMLFEQFTGDNYSFVKHPKKSLIQQSALKVYRGNWQGIIKVKLEIDELHNLIAKPKCKKKRW